MSKQLFLFIPLLFLMSVTGTNADPVRTSVLSVKDYIWGTMGEPLFSNEVQMVGRSNFRIGNETRYCEYSAYWNKKGQKQDVNGVYSRFTSFFSIDFGLRESIDIGARVPFLWVNEKGRYPSNVGVGDLLLRVRANPFGRKGRAIQVALGAGIKLPTGKYSYNEDLPTGTGTLDFSFMGYAGYNLEALTLYAYMGYVLTGKNKIGYNIEQNLGDVFSYDIALVRAVSPSVSFMVALNGHIMTSSKSDGGFKADDGLNSFAVCPAIAISIPSTNLKIEGGFSYDLFGNSVLCGTTPVLRMKINGQFRR